MEASGGAALAAARAVRGLSEAASGRPTGATRTLNRGEASEPAAERMSPIEGWLIVVALVALYFATWTTCTVAAVWVPTSRCRSSAPR